MIQSTWAFLRTYQEPWLTRLDWTVRIMLSGRWMTFLGYGVSAMLQFFFSALL